MLRRIFGLLVLSVGIGLVAFYFQDILNFSNDVVLQREAQPAVAAKNWDKVIPMYEAAVKEHPSNVAIALKLARYYARAEQWPKAEGLYETILKEKISTKDTVEARLGLANVLRQDPERWAKAITQYRTVLKENPHDVRVLAALGSLYKEAAENPKEPREEVKRWLHQWSVYYYALALRENPKNFRAHFDLAVLYQNGHDPEKAARHYCSALLLRPDSYEARFNLGLLLIKLDYLDEAYRQFERTKQILMDEDRVEEAQYMAKRIQDVKNSVYNNNEMRGLTGRQDIPAYLNEQCLNGPADDKQQAEDATEEKKAE